MRNAAMTATISLTEDQLREIAGYVREALPPDRHLAMVERLGEACTRKQAAKEINVTVQTIGNMIEDGRVNGACGGSRVDVRSLADYIEKRAEMDHQMRIEKRWARINKTGA